MKQLLAMVFMFVGAMTTHGQGPVIDSFSHNGELTCSNLAAGSTCMVEWASSVEGPWTNTWDGLSSVVADSNGAIAVSVPMFYRVKGVPAPPSGMVLIPGGTNAGTDPDSGAYSLTVESFYMDRHEVTKAQWDAVADWATQNGYTDLRAGEGKAVNHPVQEVSWFDCVKWCNARSQKDGYEAPYYTDEGFTEVYQTGQVTEVAKPYVKTTADGYRLPTDVQWEYAARGGVASKRFPWGEDTIQHALANYNSDSVYDYDTSPTRGHHPDYDDGDSPYTSPVGSFAANGYGLCDMTGNVSEWCEDWSPGYVGVARAKHGGSWNAQAYFCRVAAHSIYSPYSAHSHIGFRAVLLPSQ